MAQSSLTCTPPNPTPPTNLSCTGATPPNVPNFTKTNYANPFNMDANGRPQSPYGVNPNPPPYFDDGTISNTVDFAANTAALASGTGATSGGTEGSYPGTGSPAYTNVNNVGAVPASTSVAAEGAGAVTTVTQTYAAGVLVPGSVASYLPNTPGSAWAAGDPGGPLRVAIGTLTAFNSPSLSPNASHASSLSGNVLPTLASISPTTTTAGSGTVSVTATGTGFTRASVGYFNGVAVPTTYVSATSLTLTIPKKAAASPTNPVTVVTGGNVVTASANLAFT